MMQTKQDFSLSRKLSSLSNSLRRIGFSYLPYINKVVNIFGVKLNDTTDPIIPFKLAAIAYFKSLIKDIKANDSFIDIHTKLILTRPSIEEYIDNLIFLRSFYIHSFSDESFFQTYHELFNSNQTVLGLREIPTKITNQEVINDIKVIFKSENKGDELIVITLDYLINELEEINGFFKHLAKICRQLTHKGVTASYAFISMLFYPSTYKKKISQCTDMIYAGCSSVYSSIVPNEQMYSQFNIFNQACRNSVQSYSQSIYTSCYQPFENLTVSLKDHVINIKANLANSSKKIRDKIIEYVTYEVNRLKGTYGNIAAFSIRKDEIIIKVAPKVEQDGEENKEWLKGFLYQINASYFYVKAKAIIDDFYIKWLQSSNIDNTQNLLPEQETNYNEEDEKHDSFDKIVSWGIARQSFDLFSKRFIDSEKNLHKYSNAIGNENEEDLKLSSITQIQQSQNVMICNNNNEYNSNDQKNDIKLPQLMSTLNNNDEDEENDYSKMTSLNDLIQANPSFKNESNQSFSSINDEQVNRKGKVKKGKKNKKKH